MAKDQKKKRKEKDKERLSEQDITTKRKINKKNKKKNDNAGLGLQDNGASKLITDERFSSVHSDPRFQNVPKKQSKVPIDSRFQRMFSDKAFSSSSRLDKRGKPICQTKPNPLLHYYSHEQDEEPDSNLGLQRRGVRRSLDSTSSESELSDEDGAVAEEGVDDDSDSDTTTTDEDEGIYLEDDHSEKEDLPLIEHETRRLAIVDMDWNHVKAADLYVLMSSFLPKGGQILSVAVYPSDFGLKRMEEEAVHGPTGIFDSDEDHSEDDDAEVDEEKLRAYEKSRLKYYYAVVECDSIATADYLYKTCDGVEFERTSNVLDLRFISDSVEFKHPPRDVATEAPTSYEGLDFHTRALQHSKIDLSWDEDEPHRTKSLKRKFNPNQLAEMEFKEFLASDDGETDDDENDEAVALPDSQSKTLNKRELYRALIQSGDGSDEDTNADKDMEVTFNTGLEDISKRILERQKDKKSETVWEAYLRKRSEKKKVRKKGSKFSSSDENSSDSDQEAATEEPDDFFIEEAVGTDVKSNAKTSTKKNLKERKQPSRISEEQEASRAELELLLADEQGTDRNLKGYNLKSKKLKGKKGKKEVVAEDKIPSVDYDDPRFSALFKSHLFALDPTDPQFKRSAAYARQLSQKQKKGDEEEAPEDVKTRLTREVPLLADDLPPKKDKHLQSSDISSKKEKHELSSLVRSVKRKVGTIQS